MSKYRFDSRSEEEFKKHIKECSIFERDLMRRYVKYLNSKSTDVYEFEDNGIDNSGEFIGEDKDVDAKPDFVLLKNKSIRRKIEIKHCKPERTCFHIKLNHINRCIEEDVCIINWMGTDTNNARFCILTPDILRKSLETGYRCSMWSKPVIRFYCKDFVWYAA